MIQTAVQTDVEPMPPEITEKVQAPELLTIGAAPGALAPAGSSCS